MKLLLVLQIVGTAAGITGALFAVVKNRLTWACYMVSNVCLSAVFLMKGIWIPILQYVVFATINVVGWRQWTKNKTG